MQDQSSNHTQSARRALVVALCWLKPGAAGALAEFRREAAPLFEKYGLRVERALRGTGKGQLVGTNPHDVPDLIQILSFPSVEAFRAYVIDPDYLRLAQLRDAHVARMTVLVGNPREIGPRGRQASEERNRLYGVAFVRFQPGGAQGMDEFNRRAQTLFDRHGMHIELASDVMNIVAPIGQPLAGFTPERVIVFYLDDPQALLRYAADPEYKQLAPIRDKGLAAYDFFLGKVPS